MLTDGMAGGKAAEEQFVVAVLFHAGEKLPSAAFEAGKALGREIVFCYQHDGSSICIQVREGQWGVSRLCRLRERNLRHKTLRIGRE